MKKLTRRTAIAAAGTALAAVTALAATPVLAALVPSLDGPLDMTPETIDWGWIADRLERIWRKGKLPQFFARVHDHDGPKDDEDAFANSLEAMWLSDRMPEALETMRAAHCRQLAWGVS